MQKDLKIGMILGLVLVTIAMLWLFAGPGLSPKVKILNLRNNRETAPLPETSSSINSSDTESAENNKLSTTENQSQEPDWKKYRQDEKIKTHRFHIIREGDTLSEISRKYYDSATKWQKILDANRDVIEDVSKLKPGTKILIPE